MNNEETKVMENTEEIVEEVTEEEVEESKRFDKLKGAIKKHGPKIIKGAAIGALGLSAFVIGHRLGGVDDDDGSITEVVSEETTEE